MIEEIDTVNLPSWAITYIEYGDNTNLTDDEEREINDWLAEYEGQYDNITFSYGEADEFNTSPAFGLPCSTVKTVLHGSPSLLPFI